MLLGAQVWCLRPCKRPLTAVAKLLNDAVVRDGPTDHDAGIVAIRSH